MSMTADRVLNNGGINSDTSSVQVRIKPGRNFMYGPIKWVRDEGEHKNLRLIMAIFAAVILAATGIGLVVVFAGMIEWHRQAKAMKDKNVFSARTDETAKHVQNVQRRQAEAAEEQRRAQAARDQRRQDHALELRQLETEALLRQLETEALRRQAEAAEVRRREASEAAAETQRKMEQASSKEKIDAEMNKIDDLDGSKLEVLIEQYSKLSSFKECLSTYITVLKKLADRLQGAIANPKRWDNGIEVTNKVIVKMENSLPTVETGIEDLWGKFCHLRARLHAADSEMNSVRWDVKIVNNGYTNRCRETQIMLDDTNVSEDLKKKLSEDLNSYHAECVQEKEEIKKTALALQEKLKKLAE